MGRIREHIWFIVACLMILSTVCQAKGDEKEKKILTLSDGKYYELFDQDSVEQIGSILYNVYTEKIIGFVQADLEKDETQLQPEIISRWLSTDPLAAKYPGISPYAFCFNNPIIYVDKDGERRDYQHQREHYNGQRCN